MTGEDVRWQQRLDNYVRALAQLRSAVQLAATRELSELENQGMIQAFEFTHELAWNVMKDYFFFQGASQITGSRDATRQAFSVGLVADGEAWMEMVQSRNQSSHTYNRATALSLVERITKRYAALFEQFADRMNGLRSD
ncbi:nucleotidyltransferase substrate binding protein [Variovorax sp. RHLX14]|uniref:nucleotidyltransferase substrate binding protein n=1 Tax=Variovorax sp. RHLX14 TaxID=1259731 RepID=UPI003F45AA31